MWTPNALLVLVTWVAVATSLPPEGMHCLVRLESDYQIEALSSAGAVGIAQFMPETHRWLAEKAQAELGFAPQLGNPVHDLLLLSWAIKSGYGEHWAAWRFCKEHFEYAR